jgi:hypothetical protein
MKVKTSLTLSESEDLPGIIAQTTRDEQNARDLDTINRSADRLNEEAADVLSYQVLP